MPGLAGVITDGASLQDADGIRRALHNVQRVNGITHIERDFGSDQAVISNILTGLLETTVDQPGMSPSGNTLLFLEGEIFNHSDLRKLAGDQPDSSPCGVLLQLFEKFGDDFVRHVNGEFNVVVYQKAEMKVSIYSDHVASMPMYYMACGDRFVFGSEKKSLLILLHSSPAIDAVGLLQIFAHRHNLDDRTFLKGVKRMMPGTRLTYQRGRLRDERYDLLKFCVPESLPRIEELGDQWAEHLKSATSRRLQGKKRLLVSLSAGLDSRAVACAIPRNCRPVVSRTRGAADAVEPRLSSRIANRLAFDHFREDPGVSSYSQIIPKIAWRTECEVHFSNGISLSNHPMIKDRADFIIGGWLGDVSSGGHISPFHLRPGARAEFIERTYHRYLVYSAGALGGIFTREFLTENFPKLREAFKASFQPLEAATNIQLFEIWDLYQRQRRMTTSSMPVDSYAFEKVRPFYDKDYLNFTLTLPSRYRFGQVLYQAMIYRLGPEIRDIPSANSGLKVHSSLARNLMNKGITESGKVMQKTSNFIRPARWKKMRHGLSEDLAAGTRRDIGLRRLIEDFIASSEFDPSVFNKSGIEDMLNQHYEGAADRAYELGYVATFAAGLPYFLNRTLRCPPEAEPLM